MSAARIDTLERQVSLLQCACGAALGIALGALAFGGIRDCHQKHANVDGQRDPELPVSAPVSVQRENRAGKEGAPVLDRNVIKDVAHGLGQGIPLPPLAQPASDPHAGDGSSRASKTDS